MRAWRVGLGWAAQCNSHAQAASHTEPCANLLVEQRTNFFRVTRVVTLCQNRDKWILGGSSAFVNSIVSYPRTDPHPHEPPHRSRRVVLTSALFPLPSSLFVCLASARARLPPLPPLSLSALAGHPSYRRDRE